MTSACALFLTVLAVAGGVTQSLATPAAASADESRGTSGAAGHGNRGPGATTETPTGVVVHHRPHSVEAPPAPVTTAPRPPTQPVRRPNIVLVTTDDEALVDMRWMPKTRKLLTTHGLTFTNFLSPHPLCCPARAEILTGQFAQNNGVLNNQAPYGGFTALDSTSTLPVWMHEAGYTTAFMGKYLNGYGRDNPHDVPAGWDSWQGSYRGVYDYTHVALNENGTLNRYPDYYQTDLYSALTEKLVPELAARHRPFFIWQSQVSPHIECVPGRDRPGHGCWGIPPPPRRYAGRFASLPVPALRDPAFDERNVSDKPSFISRRHPLTHQQIAYVKRLFRSRIEGLQAVDDSVVRTVDALRKAGVLDKTIIIFTSDNGYLFGQHRYVGKTVGYEQSLRVPMIIWGPGIPQGQERHQTALTVDLAPTILALAGARPGLVEDGRNLLRIIHDPTAPGWKDVLIQAGPLGPTIDPMWTYRGVRTHRYTYVDWEYTGEKELYDRRKDPYELHNVAGERAYARVQSNLAATLAELRDCAGAQCRHPLPIGARGLRHTLLR